MGLLDMFKDEFSERNSKNIINDAIDIVSHLSAEEREELLINIYLYINIMSEEGVVSDSVRSVRFENNIRAAVGVIDNYADITEKYADFGKIGPLRIISIIHKTLITPNLQSLVNSLLAFFTSEIPAVKNHFTKMLKDHDQQVKDKNFVNIEFKEGLSQNTTVSYIYTSLGEYIDEGDVIFDLETEDESEEGYLSPVSGVVRKINIEEDKPISNIKPALIIEKYDIEKAMDDEELEILLPSLVKVENYANSIANHKRLDCEMYFSFYH